MRTVAELLEELNSTDETTRIEAKRGSAISRSVLETICAFANEPGLNGGHLLLGVERDEISLFPAYTVTGVADPDKLQLDLSSQCASMFSQAIRPRVEVERTSNGAVVHVRIDELSEAQKPVYFKSEGLPRGAYRRIGSSDQRCTDDDLGIFYSHGDSYDASIVKDSSWEDVDESAIREYRRLRAKVKEDAEELNFDDPDLLRSLNCVKKENGELRLTVAGLHLFGSKMALRRLAPATRVDYIRVPGNEWVQNPDDRFTTVDMRGPLLLLLPRIYSAVVDDLPKGFLLPEGELQAKSIGLPGRVLREALVNALMHRSFRVNQPIQVIRYGNRIEIRNPGYSLKSEDALGEPGSKQRNPSIAAVFHETNLAETKGSGIRTMRQLMERSSMVPPTFESDHGSNEFTSRLLLHHFLSEEDLRWLSRFKDHNLSENEKKALVFVREVGALDNHAYRQITGLDVLKASTDLRQLKKIGLLEPRGKGRATYYIPGEQLRNRISHSAPPQDHGAPPQDTETSITLSADDEGVVSGSGAVAHHSAPPRHGSTPPGATRGAPPLPDELTDELRAELDALGKRADTESIMAVIVKLCAWRELRGYEIASLLGRSEKYILRKLITPLRESGRLTYTIPDMVNHPQQAYRATK